MKGVGVSPGIAIARAFVLKNTEAMLSGVLLKNEGEIATDIARFQKAIDLAVAEIELIKAGPLLTEEELGIIEIQAELLNDPQITGDVIAKIKTYKNASDALIEVITEVVQVFESLDDEYMSSRSADIKDTGNLILKHLKNPGETTTQKFDSPVIIIADDITPSETISMDIAHVLGFATMKGSKTSHAAIIAKAKGIPAVVACGDQLLTVKNNDTIILDGRQGLVIVNPREDVINAYRLMMEIEAGQNESLKALKEVPSVTADGTEIKLTGNISDVHDLDDVFENGGVGVGLLRTELLFMNRDSFPTEDEQFDFYKAIALRSKNKPVIVRTLDIGGDKNLAYFNIPTELNPFLGYRAIRISLDRADLFMAQLKAILRAGLFGDLKIMLPMISNIDEVRAVKKILADAKKELTAGKIPFKAETQMGVMIEIPSAAVTADILAKEVDFFSIGTNDLCQYTLAVDRMNEKISHLYDPFNPGVLRLILNVIEQGHKHNIHVGMCGEMASDPLATLLLIGMGLKEFSMGPASIPEIKNIIISHSKTNAKQVCRDVMAMDSSAAIKTYLEQITV